MVFFNNTVCLFCVCKSGSSMKAVELSPPHVLLVERGSGCWKAGCRSRRSLAPLDVLEGTSRKIKIRTINQSFIDQTLGFHLRCYQKKGVQLQLCLASQSNLKILFPFFLLVAKSVVTVLCLICINSTTVSFLLPFLVLHISATAAVSQFLDKVKVSSACFERTYLLTQNMH